MRTAEQLKTLGTGELIRQRDDLLLGMERGGSTGQDRMIIANMGTVLKSRGIPDDMTHDSYTDKYGVFGRGSDLAHGISRAFAKLSGPKKDGPGQDHDFG